MTKKSILPLITAIGLTVVSAASHANAQEFSPGYGPQFAPPQQTADEPVQISSQQWRDVLERLERAEWELQNARNSPPPYFGEPTPDRWMGFQPPADPVADAAPADKGAADKGAQPEEKQEAPKKPDEPGFPKVKFSGFLHADAGFFSQDPTSVATVGDMQNGVGFRRARLQAVGSVTEFTNYSLEMDFAQAGRPSFQDVWVEQTNLPLINAVRIGHFRQPCTMESYTPVRQLTFLERALPFQAFDPFRRTGIMAYDKTEDELTTMQNSVYRTGGFNNAPLGDSRFGTDIGDSGGFSYGARATHLLWYDEAAEGRYLLHVGGNFNYSRTTGNDHFPPGTPTGTPFYEARAFPEFFLGDPSAVALAGLAPASVGTPFFVDTGRIPARDFEIFGLELAGQYGPAHFQSEFVFTSVNQIGGPTLWYDGAYAQAGYFLTGENRTYNRNFGAFDKLVPFEDFFSVGDGICGWGAWEVAARVSYVDLNDPNAAPIPATVPPFNSGPGRLTDSTFGLNWYWNAYTKIQFNWIHCWLDNFALGDSDADIYGCRTQLEF